MVFFASQILNPDPPSPGQVASSFPLNFTILFPGVRAVMPAPEVTIIKNRLLFSYISVKNEPKIFKSVLIGLKLL
jgi:hypothetical protein